MILVKLASPAKITNTIDSLNSYEVKTSHALDIEMSESRAHSVLEIVS